MLAGALGRWVGHALEEFADEPWAVGEVARLAAIRATAVEDLAEALTVLERFVIGVTGLRTFVSPDHPEKVAIMADVPDMDVLNAAMQSPEFGEAMVHDGVLPETVVFLVES